MRKQEIGTVAVNQKNLDVHVDFMTVIITIVSKKAFITRTSVYITFGKHIAHL